MKKQIFFAVWIVLFAIFAQAVTFSSVSPSDTATDVPIPTTLSVVVDSANNQQMNITFYGRSYPSFQPSIDDFNDSTTSKSYTFTSYDENNTIGYIEIPDGALIEKGYLVFKGESSETFTNKLCYLDGVELRVNSSSTEVCTANTVDVLKSIFPEADNRPLFSYGYTQEQTCIPYKSRVTNMEFSVYKSTNMDIGFIADPYLVKSSQSSCNSTCMTYNEATGASCDIDGNDVPLNQLFIDFTSTNIWYDIPVNNYYNTVFTSNTFLGLWLSVHKISSSRSDGLTGMTLNSDEASSNQPYFKADYSKELYNPKVYIGDQLVYSYSGHYVSAGKAVDIKDELQDYIDSCTLVGGTCRVPVTVFSESAFGKATIYGIDIDYEPFLGNDSNVADGGNATYEWSTTSPDTTYQWTFRARNSGEDTTSGTTYTFTTTGALTFNQVKANSSTNNSIEDILGWCSVADNTDSDINYEYAWYKNNSLQITNNITGLTDNTLLNIANLTSGNLTPNDVWIFGCRGYDGSGNFTSWNNATSITIINNHPSFNHSLVNQTINHNTSLSYDVNATDLEHSITYSVNDSIVTINSTSGLITDSPLISETGTYVILVTAFDGFDSISESFNYTITNTDPILAEVNVTGKYAQIDAQGYCNATDSDNDDISFEYEWFVNGVYVQSASTTSVAEGTRFNVANLSSSNYQGGDTVILQCRATDGFAYTNYQNSSVVMEDIIVTESVTIEGDTSGDTEKYGFCNVSNNLESTVSFEYEWFVNDINVLNGSLTNQIVIENVSFIPEGDFSHAKFKNKNGINHVIYTKDVIVGLKQLTATIWIPVYESFIEYCNDENGSFSCEEATGNTSRYSSLAIDKNNNAHISYQDTLNNNYKLKYCNNVGGSFSCEVLDGYGVYSSIAVDSINNIHISHINSTSDELRYCTNSSGSFSCEVVEITSSEQYATSITTDLNNNVHISHSGDGDLRYCNNVGGSFSCELVDESDYGKYSSIAIDSINNIHISFTDEENDEDGYNVKHCTNSSGSFSCEVVNDVRGIYTNIDIKNNKIGIVYLNQNITYCDVYSENSICTQVVSSGNFPVLEYVNNIPNIFVINMINQSRGYSNLIQYINNVQNINTNLSTLLPGNFSGNDEVIFMCRGNTSTGVYSDWTNSSTLTIDNTPPQMNSSRISPNSTVYEHKDLDMYCTPYDEDGDSMTIDYIVYKNNAIFTSNSFSPASSQEYNLYTLDESNIAKNDNITLSCRASDGQNTSEYFNSSTLTISNSPPVLSTVTLNDTSITTLDDVEITCSGEDNNSDNIYYYFEVIINDVVNISGYTQNGSGSQNVYNITNIYAGDSLKANCTIFDEENLQGNELQTNEYSVTDYITQITASTSGDSEINETLLGYCNATTNDGSDVGFQYRWYKNDVLNSSGSEYGLSQDIKHNIANITSLQRDDQWIFSCKGNETYGYTSSWTNSTAVTVQNSLPQLESASTDHAGTSYINQTLQGYCNASDINLDELTIYYKWFVDNVLNASGNVSGITQNISTNIANLTGLQDGEIVKFECKANDGTSNSTALNSSQVEMFEDFWRFTLNEPLNGSTLQPVNTTLNVSVVTKDGSDTSLKFYNQSNLLDTQIISNGSSGSYGWNNLLKNTTYYWKVVANDTQNSSLWEFTTAPNITAVDAVVNSTNYNVSEPIQGWCYIVTGEGLNVNYSFEWYRDGVLQSSGNTVNSSNEYVNIANVSPSTSNEGEWYLRCMGELNEESTDWVASENTTIGYIPDVTSYIPSNNSVFTNTRYVNFFCGASDDGTIANFTLNINNSYSETVAGGSWDDVDMSVAGSYSWYCTACDNLNLCANSETKVFNVTEFASIDITPKTDWTESGTTTTTFSNSWTITNDGTVSASSCIPSLSTSSPLGISPLSFVLAINASREVTVVGGGFSTGTYNNQFDTECITSKGNASIPYNPTITLTVTSEPTTGGGGGGGSSITKRLCDITIDPDVVRFNRNPQVVEVIIKNDDTLTYNPNIEIVDEDGDMDGIVRITNTVDSILPGRSENFGVSYDAPEFTPSEARIKFSSSNCFDIYIDVEATEGFDVGSGLQDIIGDKTLIEIAFDPIFPENSPLRDTLPFISIGLVGLLLMILIFALLNEEIRDRIKQRQWGLTFVFVLIAIGITIVVTLSIILFIRFIL
ncbi:MAG: hypothetical protein ACE5RP_00150 [Nitrosopumilus sp.]